MSRGVAFGARRGARRTGSSTQRRLAIAIWAAGFSGGAALGPIVGGFLLGYTAIVDPAAFGWHAEAFVDLYCEGRMPGEAIRRAVEREPGVVSAHTVAGEASALLHVRAADTKDLESALERIRAADGITRTVTEVVLSTLVRR